MFKIASRNQQKTIFERAQPNLKNKIQNLETAGKNTYKIK
jgi:hypothetical protein